MKRRVEIVIEHERTIVWGGTGVTHDAWCVRCASTVQFVGIRTASAAAATSIRSIVRWVEEGRVHFIEQDHDLFVCLPSFSRIDQPLPPKEDPHA